MSENTTIETVIDKVASVFLFATFPLMMTGGAMMMNQSNPDQIVEGTTLTVAELSSLLVIAGFVSFVIGLILVLSFLVLPKRILRSTLPNIRVEW